MYVCVCVLFIEEKNKKRDCWLTLENERKTKVQNNNDDHAAIGIVTIEDLRLLNSRIERYTNTSIDSITYKNSFVRKTKKTSFLLFLLQPFLHYTYKEKKVFDHETRTTKD